jgi:DNA/RNA endonuclease G (NUC1)
MPQNINRKAKLIAYLTSVDEVEKQTGLDFLAGN